MEPVPQIRLRNAGALEPRQTHLPELEVHRLRQGYPEPGVLAGGKGAIGQRGQSRCPECGTQSFGELRVSQQVNAGLASPTHGYQLPAERKQVIVVALEP